MIGPRANIAFRYLAVRNCSKWFTEICSYRMFLQRFLMAFFIRVLVDKHHLVFGCFFLPLSLPSSHGQKFLFTECKICECHTSNMLGIHNLQRGVAPPQTRPTILFWHAIVRAFHAGRVWQLLLSVTCVEGLGGVCARWQGRGGEGRGWEGGVVAVQVRSPSLPFPPCLLVGLAPPLPSFLSLSPLSLPFFFTPSSSQSLLFLLSLPLSLPHFYPFIFSVSLVLISEYYYGSFFFSPFSLFLHSL